MTDCTHSLDLMKPSEAFTCAAQGVGNLIRRFAEGLDSIPLGQWTGMIVAIVIIVAGIACVVFTAKFLDRLIKWFGQKEELERTDEGKLLQNKWGAFIMACGFASGFLETAGQPGMMFMALWLCGTSVAIFVLGPYWWGHRPLPRPYWQG